MRKRWGIMLPISIVLAGLLFVSGCTPPSPFLASGTGGPQIKVIAPAPFSTTSQGDTVIVRATIQDPRGINQVALRVNGQAGQMMTLPTQPVTDITQELLWTPQSVGTFEIAVDAQNRDGEWGQSQPMTVYVVGALARETIVAVASSTPLMVPTLTPTVVPAATATAGASGSPPECCSPCVPSQPATQPHACYDNATFVSDVTVPDGTVFAPRTAFDKTWRLRNNGSCTWNTGYQLAFVGGSQLGAPGAVNIPHEVSPGNSVDISVPMVAPEANGTYRSNWQLRNPDCGNLFGPIVYTHIKVHSDTGNLPTITRFDVVPNTISQGGEATLYWEYANGTSARIQPGDTPVGPSGSQPVNPNTTTTYRLIVTNAAGSVERTATLIVQAGPVPAPPPSSPANLTIIGTRADGFDFTWTDTSVDEQGFRLHNAITQEAVATFSANVTSSAIAGLNCGTPYSFYLVAFNERGDSWPSNTVQATTSPCDG
jgi:hypothetical protein